MSNRQFNETLLATLKTTAGQALALPGIQWRQTCGLIG